MANQRPYGIISAGLVIIFVGLMLYLSIIGVVSLYEVPSLVILCSGLWLLVIAGLRWRERGHYEMGAFSTAGWGVVLIALGTLWFLTIRQYAVDVFIVVFVLIFGVLILVAGLRQWSFENR